MNDTVDIPEPNVQIETDGAPRVQNFISVYDRILQRIRIRSRRRIAWLRKLWVQANPSAEGESLNLHSEVDNYLNNNDSTFAEATWFIQEKAMYKLNEELEEAEVHLLNDNSSRLSQLKIAFGLNKAEMDTIQSCLALYIDPNLGRVYAYLHDHNGRGYVSSQLVARLFGYGAFIIIGSSSPLTVWNLIKETDMGRSEPARLELDPFIRNWLLGSTDPDPFLSDSSSVQAVKQALPHWPATETVAMIRHMFSGEYQRICRVFVAACEGTGRRSFAAIVCSRLGLKLLSVQTDRFNKIEWNNVYMKARRQALLEGYALLWDGEIPLNNPWPCFPGASGLQFVIGEADDAPLNSGHIVDIRIELTDMPVKDACKRWKETIPAAASWPEEELDQMLRRHKASIGQLIAVSKKNVVTVEQASEELRSMSRHRLGDLAKQINSSFCWDDLVIAPALQSGLQDFYYEATERTSVWEQAATKRLFPHGQGLMALFTGSPGTGKTMAAQVIANNLQLDLFRIDLSAMVSKYIGETSKNIQRILSRARRMDVVLLFDEADALFGKRTDVKDAHDRYANTDTNYLLQAIEEYPGIAILASNRKANIDTGFSRRLRYILEFQKPDATQRLQLWRKMVTELAGKQEAVALEGEMKRVADMIDVTGAQIKLSVLSALYMARREKRSVSAPHLLKGLERELAKEGRGLGKQVQEVFRHHLIRE